MSDVYEPHFTPYPSGYFCELFAVEGGSNEFRVAKHVDVGYVEIASVEFDWSIDTWYLIKINIIGNEIKAKVWAEGTAEPDWLIETTDNDWEEGLAGIGSYNAVENENRYYDFVGFGWLGAPPPMEAIE